MNRLCFHHISIAVDDLERARQFYTEVMEMQELDRPDGFGHPGIWYQIGDGQPQVHILVRSEATLRRDKWIDLADIHFALRVQSYRDTVLWLDSKGFRADLPDAQRIADILGNGHVGVERVGLEDHCDVAVARLKTRDIPVADQNATRGRRFQSGEEAQF